MLVDAILCNHAEAVNNLLYVAGGGINVSNFQPGAPPPYAISVGLGLLVTVPWLETNKQHQVQIKLIGEDGQDVVLPTRTGAVEPLNLAMAFNVGRPAGIRPGDEQVVTLAANLVSLPIPAAGKYEFVIQLDGELVRRLPLRVQPAPGAQMTFG